MQHVFQNLRGKDHLGDIGSY